MRQIKVDNQTKSDCIEDLLAGFEWAFGLSPTEQERDKFRKARDVEWQSGDATWQFPLIRAYRQGIAATPSSNQYRFVQLRGTYQKAFQNGARAALNEPLYRNVTQAGAGNTSAQIEEKEWLEAWIKKGKPIDKFIFSKAKRAFYEKENTIIASTERDSPYAALGVGKLKSELETPYVVKGVENFNTIYNVGLSLADREELAKRIIEDWKQNGELSSTNPTPRNAIQCFLAETYYYNADKFHAFVKMGDANGKWLQEKLDNGFFWQSPLPSLPATNLAAFRDYAAYRICQVNQVAGENIVPLTPTVKAKIIERAVQQWGTLSAEKKKEILNGTKTFATHQNIGAFNVPILHEYQCHLWGQDLVKSTPELKLIVEKRAAYFRNLVTKDPNWKVKAEIDQKKLEQNILQMQGEYLRGQTERMKSAMDDLVKSSHVLSMNILENTKTGPADTYWYLKRINP
jgi:hypothetical protein